MNGCTIKSIVKQDLVLRVDRNDVDLDRYFHEFAIGDNKFRVSISCRPSRFQDPGTNQFLLRKWSDNAGWLDITRIDCEDLSRRPAGEDKRAKYEEKIRKFEDRAKFYATGACNVNDLPSPID